MNDPHELLDQTRAWLHRHELLRRGTTVLVAVSGGADSVCLLHALRTLADECGVRLHVAHLDHGLRGADSAADAAWVAALAESWGLPATVVQGRVADYARRHGHNLHEAARLVRYRFLAETAQSCGATALAVAHHANDQAETVLLHLLRGAGTTGLRGMRPLVPWDAWAAPLLGGAAGSTLLIRPLLAQSRAAIDAYCAAHGLAARLDSTNADQRYTRNRIRADLLPRLIEYNSHVVAALGRTAAVCADDADFIAAALEQIWPQLAQPRSDGIDFAGPAWQQAHPALQRAALRRAFAMLAGGETLGWEQIEHARALITRGVGKQLHLPGGLLLQVGYGGAFSLGAPRQASAPQLRTPTATLALPGRTPLADGWAIVCREAGAAPPPPPGRWEVYLDADSLDGPLLVRQRQPGDRLALAHTVGHRRVQDLLVDAKIDRALRAHWPIIATAHAVVWVAGVRAAASFLATPTTTHSIHIQIIPDDVEQGGNL